MQEYSVQRFRGGYAVVYRDETGKRHRERLYAADKPGADAEARQRWGKGDGAAWTVGKIVTAYMADRAADGIASAQRQSDAWKAMRGYWDTVDPALIDKPMAQAYAKRRGVGPATIRYELSMLAVALRWAAAKPRCYIKDAAEVWRPAAPERKTRHLSQRQFEKWYAEVKAPHARLYVLLGLYTMARPSAILELTWDRVDFDKGEVDLNPKGRKQTKKRRPVVPLNAEALEALQAAYAGRQTENVIERGSQPVKSIKKAFQAASERSGITATPYTLRHTGAVWAAESGKVSMAELAQFLGHDDSATTETHYARFTPGHLRGVANAVQRKNK